jgi:hypothetical protein
MLRNQLYAGIVDVRKYGVRDSDSNRDLGSPLLSKPTALRTIL